MIRKYLKNYFFIISKKFFFDQLISWKELDTFFMLFRIFFKSLYRYILHPFLELLILILVIFGLVFLFSPAKASASTMVEVGVGSGYYENYYNPSSYSGGARWLQYFPVTENNISDISLYLQGSIQSDIALHICKGPSDATADMSDNCNCTGASQTHILTEHYSATTTGAGWYTFDVTDTYVQNASNYYFCFDTDTYYDVAKTWLNDSETYSLYFRGGDGYPDSYPGYTFAFKINYDEYFNPDIYTNEMAWYFPQDDYVISNSEWNDWGIYYHLDSNSLHNHMLLKIYYQDVHGDMYLDTDWISTTTDLTYWTVNRSASLPDGQVFSWAEIIGTDLEGCSSVTDPSCIWYSSASLDMINWVASSTGSQIWDYGLTGFIPASTTVMEFIFGTSSLYYLSCTEEEWESGDWWTVLSCKTKYTFYTTVNTAMISGQSAIEKALVLIRNMFPFNIGFQISDSWEESATASLPSAFDFLDLTDEYGNMYISIPSSLMGGATTTIAVFGPIIFNDNDDGATWFENCRSLSTYFLYILFVMGIIYRGYALYDEYTS